MKIEYWNQCGNYFVFIKIHLYYFSVLFCFFFKDFSSSSFPVRCFKRAHSWDLIGVGISAPSFRNGHESLMKNWMQTEAGNIHLLQGALVTFEPGVRFSHQSLSKTVEAHHKMAASTLSNEQFWLWMSPWDVPMVTTTFCRIESQHLRLLSVIKSKCMLDDLKYSVKICL